jgi:hypothetical protein
MSSTSTIHRSPTRHVGIESAWRNDLASALRQDLTSYNGPSIAFGIMLAGGAYPLVLTAIYLVVAFVFVAWSWVAGFPIGTNLPEAVAFVFFTILGGAMAAIVGVVWAAFVSFVTLPVVYLFVRSLKLRGTLVGLGAISGGLVGFVVVLPLTLSLPWMGGSADGWTILIVFALGPGLTTVLGQLGGAWGGKRAMRYAAAANWKATMAASGELQAAMGWQTSNSLAESRPEEPRLQFRLRHLLWLFVWLSMLMSVIRLSGIPYQFVLPLLIGWIAYQSATLAIGWQVGRRLGPWWTARQASGST